MGHIVIEGTGVCKPPEVPSLRGLDSDSARPGGLPVAGGEMLCPNSASHRMGGFSPSREACNSTWPQDNASKQLASSSWSLSVRPAAKSLSSECKGIVKRDLGSFTGIKPHCLSNRVPWPPLHGDSG